MLMIAAPGFSAALAQQMEMPMAGASPTPGGRVAIPQPLLISLQAAPAYGPAPLTVGFLLNAADPSGGRIVAYRWNFGDGHISTAPPIVLPFNTYANPGTYVATVTVTTADGRSATGFTSVIVKPATAAQP